MKIVGAEEAYQSIPKILLPDEYEYRDDENDRERCERRENWLQNLATCFEVAGRRRFDHDRHRRLSRRGVAERAVRRGREFVQRAETAGNLCDQAVDHSMNRLDLVVHGRQILRQVPDEGLDLRADDRADQQYDRQRHDHREDDGDDLREPGALQQLHDRREKEAEKDRQSYRDEHIPREVERRDDNDAGRQPQQSLGPRSLSGRYFHLW